MHSELWRDCKVTYLSRISGPLLDRIDLHIQVPAVKYKDLALDEKSEDSAAIRERILAARQIRFRRLEPSHNGRSLEGNPKILMDLFNTTQYS